MVPGVWKGNRGLEAGERPRTMVQPQFNGGYQRTNKEEDTGGGAVEDCVILKVS